MTRGAARRNYHMLSADLTAVLPELTGQRGLLGIVNIDDDGIAPAHFHQGMNVLTVNPVDGVTFPTRFDVESLRATPVFAGLVAHEASHARFSGWMRTHIPADLPRAVREWADCLEEPRIEYRGRLQLPGAVGACLRASAMSLIVRDGAPPDTVKGAVRTLILVEGRVIGGVLNAAETTEVVEVATSILEGSQLPASEILAAITDAVGAAQKDPNTTAAVVLDAARRIASFVPLSAGKKSNGATAKGHSNASGAPPRDGKLADALQQASRIVASNAQARADAQAQLAAETTVPQVGIGKGAGTAGGVRARVASRLAPDQRDRARAHQVKNWLASEIRPTELVTTRRGPEGQSLDPFLRHIEGRLGVPRRDRQSWSDSVRRVVPAPPMSVCVVLDVSGSMGGWASAASSLAWALAAGAHDLGRGTRVGFVTFGTGVAVERTWREAVPRWVDVHQCNERSTRWTDSTRDAINRAMGWDRPAHPSTLESRRLLVVSDAHVSTGDGEVLARHIHEWVTSNTCVSFVGPVESRRWLEKWGVARLVTPPPAAFGF